MHGRQEEEGEEGEEGRESPREALSSSGSHGSSRGGGHSGSSAQVGRDTDAWAERGWPLARLSIVVVFVLKGFTTGAVVSRLPRLADRAGMAPRALSFVLLCGAAGLVLASVLQANIRVVRERSRTSLLCALPASIVVLSALGFTGTSLATCAVQFFLMGAADSVWDVSMNKLASDLEQAFHRAWMSNFHAGFSLGNLVGGLAGAFAAHRETPLGAHFLVTAILTLVVFVATARHIPLGKDEPDDIKIAPWLDGQYVRVQGSGDGQAESENPGAGTGLELELELATAADEESGCIGEDGGGDDDVVVVMLAEDDKIATQQTGDTAASSSTHLSIKTEVYEAASEQRRCSNTRFGMWLVILPVAAITFVSAVSEGSMYDWAAVLMVDSSWSHAAAAVGFSVFAASMTTVRLVGDRLLGTYSPTRVLRVCLVVASAGLFLSFLCAPNYGIFAAYLMVGAIGLVVPIVYSASARLRTGDQLIDSNFVMPVLVAASYSGSFVGPPIIGYISSVSSLRVAFAINACMLSICFVMSRFVPNLEAPT